MPSSKTSGWLVFIVSLGAYVPLIIGGIVHPVEMNIACFTLWIALSYMLMHSARVQGYEGWKLNMAFFAGNVVIVALGLIRGGYTFNLGESESILLFGIVGTLCTWIIVGTTIKKWNADILYIGGIVADVLSFYPIVKQYLAAGHERATSFGVIAWMMFGVASFLNFTLVERLFMKLWTDPADYPALFGEEKSLSKIWKTSAFSIENFSVIVMTTILMSR